MLDPHRFDLTLQRFLAGATEDRRELPRTLDPWLTRRARSLATELDRAGLIPDVVDRTWELVLRRPAAFDPRRGSALAFLAGRVRTAVRDVRAENSQPGRRTRGSDFEADRARLLAAMGPASTQCSEDLFCAAIDFRLAVERLPPDLQEAANVLAGGMSMTRAASAAGMNRATLQRRLAAWAVAADIRAAWCAIGGPAWTSPSDPAVNLTATTWVQIGEPSMASISFYSCDFEGCGRSIHEDDVQGVAVCLHEAGGVDGWEHTALSLDLCPEHFQVVANRIIGSSNAA